MRNARGFKPALVVGGLTAAVALLAGLSSANAQAPAPSPALGGAGSFPQSFIVPGTNTSLHVGGFLELDAYYDMDAGGASLGAMDNETPTAISVEGTGSPTGAPNGNSGNLRLTTQFSRTFVETRTPSAYGEIKTYWEIDFSGANASLDGDDGLPNPAGSGAGAQCCGNYSLARLRQSYGTLGPWLFGQTVSTYADLDSAPDNIDAAGNAGGYDFPGQRLMPQVRYTYLLPGCISFAGALEQVATAGQIATTSSGQATIGAAGAPFSTLVPFNNFSAPAGESEKYPAFVGRARIDQPWGHTSFQFAVVNQRFDFDGLTPASSLFTTSPIPGLPVSAGEAGNGHISKWGAMMSLSGHLNTIGQDKFTYNAVYGQGAGDYTGALEEVGQQFFQGLLCAVTNGVATPAGVAAPAGGIATAGASGATSYKCSQPRVGGIDVGYSHFWTTTWRSGIDFGYDKVSKPKAADGFADGPTGTSALAALEDRHMSAHGNLLWTPDPAVQMGLEYEWYRRVVYSGAHGSLNRIKFQTLFKF